MPSRVIRSQTYRRLPGDPEPSRNDARRAAGGDGEARPLGAADRDLARCRAQGRHQGPARRRHRACLGRGRARQPAGPAGRRHARAACQGCRRRRRAERDGRSTPCGATHRCQGTVHAHADKAGTKLQIGGTAHAVGVGGKGPTRAFYFCSDFCSHLADRLAGLLQCLPHNYPGRGLYSSIQRRARIAGNKLAAN